MRETAFIKQNKDKWIEFENVLDDKIKISPKELSELYLDITDDLSYAQTFYSDSHTLSYLNMLSARAHRKIYKTKRESRNRLLRFYSYEFPLFFYAYRKELLFAFLTFAIFVIIGMYSQANDPSFARFVLGDDYVNMTLANIEKGDPMAVYKSGRKADMFLGITINNIKVAFLAFVYGILLGLGTIYILMHNGIMLGVFDYFFYEKGLFWESFRTIWIHGTLEIAVIIVAGCAGLVIAKGILFPGTYSRLQSLIRAVKDGLKIVVSTIPFFIIAGFLESYVTRYTQMPDWLATSIIVLSLALVLFYYVFYPQFLHKKVNEHEP